MRRVIVVALVGLIALVSGCGGKSSGAADPSTGSVKVINVTFDGKDVTPNGERVDVGVGQPIEFVVKADAAGEIHVHSTPEKHLEYSAGTTVIQVGSFDTPGLIEVESHALNKTIVQLQVQ